MQYRSFDEELPEDHVAGISIWPVGGLMCEIKVPVQELRLKTLGGSLYTRGSIYAGHYGTIMIIISHIQIIKTQTTCVPDLATFIEASHPYDVPEVISVKAS